MLIGETRKMKMINHLMTTIHFIKSDPSRFPITIDMQSVEPDNQIGFAAKPISSESLDLCCGLVDKGQNLEGLSKNVRRKKGKAPNFTAVMWLSNMALSPRCNSCVPRTSSSPGKSDKYNGCESLHGKCVNSLSMK